MLEARAASVLLAGVDPTIVSPLGVVSKPHSDKLHLIINMRYLNKHLANGFYEIEGLSDIVDIAEIGDYSISHDLTSGYYHVSLHPNSMHFIGFKWNAKYYQYNCLPFGLSTAPLGVL